MKYVYESAFAPEMNRYLELLSGAGRYIDRIQSSLRGLDRYLVAYGLEQRTLHAETVSAWVKTKNVSSHTKAKDVSNINGFAKFLVSLGIDASSPEPHKKRSEYVPYAFSDAEIQRIVSAADNLEVGQYLTRSSLVFPILLRLLYGCGLRLGEGRSLRWKDVDFERGILTIREAKNQKQRFVPMSATATELLTDYRAMTQNDGICTDYLFESNHAPGKPFRNKSFYEWFQKALRIAGIHYARQSTWERGPCPHCLRHCFTLKSFLKSESEGRRFEDTAPFLAAYLGHDGPKELETYLSTNHSVYTQSHKRMDAAIGHVFPEVDFNED